MNPRSATYSLRQRRGDSRRALACLPLGARRASPIDDVMRGSRLLWWDWLTPSSARGCTGGESVVTWRKTPRARLARRALVASSALSAQGWTMFGGVIDPRGEQSMTTGPRAVHRPLRPALAAPAQRGRQVLLCPRECKVAGGLVPLFFSFFIRT